MDMEVPGKRIAISKVATGKGQVMLCELCAADDITTAANGICQECEEFMCSTCFRHHLKAKSCRHHVLDGTNQSFTPEQKRAENVEKCKRHANKIIKFYCRKHEIVGCGECMIPLHGACQPENIKDLSKRFQQNKDFKSIMAKTEGLLSANSANDKKIQERKNENKKMLEEALKSIQNFRSEVNKKLDKAERNIINEVKDIERNNDKLLAELEQECQVLLSEITEVRQKLDTELYKDSALFIQSVECNPKIIDIERTCSKIQRENEITTFEFIPDKQLQGIITSIEKLGKFTRSMSSMKSKAPSLIKNANIEKPIRNARETHEKPIRKSKNRGTEEIQKVWSAAGFITVGSRVRSVDLNDDWPHCGQPGTVIWVHPTDRVSVRWDATNESVCGYFVDEDGGVKLV